MIRIDEPGEGGGKGSGGVGGGGGSEDSYITGKNLKEGSNISLRPRILTSRHLYNLRNQSWSVPKSTFDGNDFTSDLIGQFHGKASRYPSNSDATGSFVYPNTGTTAGSKYIDRFNAQDCMNNPNGTSAAPMGYFIIDALDRGSSRKEAYDQMMSQYPSNTYSVEDLPTDESPTGATVVAEFSGRIFYSGFSGQVINPDSSSPKLSSYVLFSQLVSGFSTIYSCYQAADPTSKDISDLVDTDGGFIRINGAYNINAMANIQSGLVVLAENGVWVIKGGTGGGFTATNYQVVKVTNSGCVAPNSVVIVNNAVMYWSKDGIYNVSTNQYGDYIADNITKKTIQTMYNNIPVGDLPQTVGVYDEYEQKAKWVYGNRNDSVAPTIELSLDLNLGSFSKNTINPIGSGRTPWLFGGIQTNPFTLLATTSNVTIGSGDLVVVGSDQVFVEVSQDSDSGVNLREVQYLVITDTSPTIKFTFCNYTDPDHVDWKSVDGVGNDAKAFLLTGVLNGGDFQRTKGIRYITAHFNRTESGFVVNESGDYDFLNPSSCMFQAQWNWTDSINSKKWSNKKQLYRIRRFYSPTSIDTYDDGFPVVESKSKIRGNGKVVSLLFESEVNKHLELLGWSIIVEVNGNV